MKKVFFCWLLAISYCSAQEINRVRAIIDSLCAPYMHGRGYTNNGDKIASLFIAKHFKQAGLIAFGQSYFQPFNVTINTFSAPIKLQIGRQYLREGIDFLPHPATCAGKGKFQIMMKDSTITQNKQAEIWLTENLLHRLEDEQNDIPRFVIKKDVFFKAIAKSRQIRFQISPKLQQNYSTQNVIGYLRGTEQPDSFFVFSAHYDHLGDLGKVYFAGANDNASGVAMLIELAYYFSKNPPRYSIAFIAFGAEEIGLLGSYHYTENPYFPLSNIRFLLNLDLFGTGEKGTTAVNATLFPDEFKILHHINAEKNYLSQIGARGKAANSDHYYFSEKGVKSFFLYLQGDSWKHYHHIDDKPPLPLSGFEKSFALITDFTNAMINH